MSQAKQEFLARSKEFWNPGKTQDWIDMGVDLVIDPRTPKTNSSRSSSTISMPWRTP